MNKANYYWQVYKNLEREFVSLADMIHIDDYQLENVYSMRIADLIMRVAVEVESISKYLYVNNNGPKTNPRDMYFDADCIAYLNSLWNLESKVAVVVSPILFLEKDENIFLTPLKNAHRTGSRAAKWEKAYQAVKHDRANSITKYGKIIYLLHALAALYVLNLYNKDERIENIDDKGVKTTDNSFGSLLFAVKLHKAHGLNADGSFIKGDDFYQCVYLTEYEANSKQSGMEALKAMNDYFYQKAQPELDQLIKQKEALGLDITREWVVGEEMRILNEKGMLPIKDAEVTRKLRSFSNMHYDIVLNKQQY